MRSVHLLHLATQGSANESSLDVLKDVTHRCGLQHTHSRTHFLAAVLGNVARFDVVPDVQLAHLDIDGSFRDVSLCVPVIHYEKRGNERYYSSS